MTQIKRQNAGSHVLPADTVPVTVITGFLGSGKTTLLNHLLRQSGMAGAAVIINEFGDIPIDHLLVERILGDAVMLDSGCLCCAIRGDLVDTMSRMAWQVDNGELPPFDRLVIETSGLADPAPVLQTIMADPMLTGRYRLGGLVTTVDAATGPSRLDAFPEALKQVTLASRLLVTKTDIAPPVQSDELERRLRALNAHAPMQRIVQGEIDCAEIVSDRDYDPESAETDAARWLAGSETRHDDHAPGTDHGHDHDHSHAHAHSHEHAGGVNSFCLVRDEPLAWDAVRDWLDSLTSLRGADLLRIKGLVHVAGRDGPVVVHGVQHIFHPPRVLDAWPDADRRTRIVCITRGLAEADVANALDAAVENRRHCLN